MVDARFQSEETCAQQQQRSDSLMLGLLCPAIGLIEHSTAMQSFWFVTGSRLSERHMNLLVRGYHQLDGIKWPPDHLARELAAGKPTHLLLFPLPVE